MAIAQPLFLPLTPALAAPRLADLGFLSSSDLPDRPGPAYLHVALREVPTYRHYDPELVEYWITNAGRGKRRMLTRGTPLPIEVEFSWGLIRIIDRLHVTNEYLTFGGRLSVDTVDGVVVAVFTSPAPLLRRGGHSQGWDQGAESLGAFFGRFLLAVDYMPGFETRAAQAGAVTRYAAFVADTVTRYRGSAILRSQHTGLWNVIQAEERRLRAEHPEAWACGEVLRREATR